MNTRFTLSLSDRTLPRSLDAVARLDADIIDRCTVIGSTGLAAGPDTGTIGRTAVQQLARGAYPFQ